MRKVVMFVAGMMAALALGAMAQQSTVSGIPATLRVSNVFASTGLFVNTRPVLANYATAKINSSGTLLSGHNAASASRTSAGIYVINWTASIGSNVCVATLAGSGSGGAYPIISVATPGSTSMNINVLNGIGGTLLDIPSTLHVLCVPDV